MTASAIRPAAVAGMFYPGDPGVLSRAVFGFLEEARRRPAPRGDAPKALIVPHAGYVYSGAIAASGYARLVPHAAQIRRVVMLGPCHRVAVRGLALPGCKAFATPLGQVRVDEEAVARIATLPEVTVSARAHALDHALEVQLPFLQRLLGDFRLVPLIVGQASAEAVADVLEALWGGEETLIVISSDLSHYLPYEAAREEDRRAVDAMLALDSTLDHEHACGATPVNGLMTVARRRGMDIELLDLRNSGDTAGDKSRVVGYAAFAFSEAGDD